MTSIGRHSRNAEVDGDVSLGVRIMDVQKPGRVWTDLGVQNTYMVAVASMAHRVAKVASGDQLGLDGSVMDNG
jgi:hypothetical protein